MAMVDGNGERMRVLTLNLGGDGDKHGTWPNRVANAAALIRSDGADIVLLQAAVEKDAGNGPLSTLGAALPDHEYRAFTVAQRTADGWFGSAVLSRLPLVSVRTIPLSCMGGEDDNARVLLHVEVNLAGQPLHLLDGHFSWVAAQAAANLDETLAYAATMEGDMLLAGDLNQTPDSEFARAFAAAGWTDGWAAKRGGEDGFTFETGKLWGRIDQLWLRGSLADALIDIDVATAPAGALSDHLALRFTLGGA